MKVVCIGGLYEGCNYVRLQIPAKYCGFTYLDIKNSNPKEWLKEIWDADIVVMHRPFENHKKIIVDTIKKLGKKFVFDNDDTYKEPVGVKGVIREYAYQIDEQLMWFVRRADLVTCTTKFLKEEYRQYNPFVKILPNMVDPDDWPEIEPYQNEKFRVGIIGSIAYDDFLAVKDDLIKLSKEKDIELVVLAFEKKDTDEMERWKEIKREHHYFVPVKEYPQKLKDLKLDLMIIPREDNYFNRCKSNIKFLEASMIEVPVLAQSFSDGTSPYEINKSDKDYLVLVKDHWYEAVMEAKANKNYLKQLAKRAKQYVLEKYNIKNNYQLWIKKYTEIYNRII